MQGSLCLLTGEEEGMSLSSGHGRVHRFAIQATHQQPRNRQIQSGSGRLLLYRFVRGCLRSAFTGSLSVSVEPNFASTVALPANECVG